ncbi:hypothetical protein BKA69DRAFT_1037462 [Paraphysoderma sedebokerense]|nr:hypothetical protein BKA69DRAFT_1037462 [Paraphysoderma sedebokerense]
MSGPYQYAPWIIPSSLVPHNRAMIFIACLGILSNLLLLGHFYRNRVHLNVSSATLVQITVCDLLLFISSAYITIAHDIAENHELPWSYCQMSGINGILALGTSCVSFVVIAAERYFHIIHGRKITVRQLCVLWFFAWCSSGIQAIIPLATGTYFVPQDSNWYCLGDFSGTSAGHRAYSIFSLVNAYIGCGIVTIAYYSIYKKTIADGFKWSEFTFKRTQSTAVSHSKESGSEIKSNASRGTAVAVNSTKSVTIGVESFVRPLNQQTNAQQIRLTLRLAFYTFYFLSIWLGTAMSWTYQTITASRIPPNVDFILTFIPVFGSVLNPILVLTIDQRWKVQLPRQLQCFICRDHIAVVDEDPSASHDT